MVEADRNDKSENISIQEIADRMMEVDSKIPSPQDRAAIVFAKLKEVMPGLSVWDTICFASEYIGSQVATLPFIEAPAKDMLMLLYTYHYQYPESVDPSFSPHVETKTEGGSKNGNGTPTDSSTSTT